MKDPYEVMGVAKNATDEEIRRAHLRLARKHHPDLNPGDKRAEDRFKEIQEAYDILSDPETRRKYDTFGQYYQTAGEAAPPPAGEPRRGQPFPDINAHGLNLDELLERMFGGSRGNRAQQATSESPQPAQEHTLEISLEEAWRGTARRITLALQDVCPDCGGSGVRRTARGAVDLGGPPCPRCNGAGQIGSSREGEVKIPPGAWDGLRLKLAGQGAASATGQRSDVVIRLRIRPHPAFERDGQDLIFDGLTPYTVAVLGGEISVTMLDGRKRSLVVPPGVQSGQRLRIAGQGMPALQDRPQGDAYARIRILVPKTVTGRERELLQELAELRRDTVRSERGGPN
ncbi:MAG: J domain-containing protein [Armatimonadetes bacterium]|nr:J domain-containing protein [Armatimonadota bacterium]MDE2207222.1 J domain-containing protein [Armatimonadota bacterium]